jgi:hypothetical protein
MDWEPTRNDQQYLRRLDERGPAFSLHLAAGILHDVIAMLNLQVQREFPHFSERERRLEAARRLYFGDPAAQRLLDRVSQQ